MSSKPMKCRDKSGMTKIVQLLSIDFLVDEKKNFFFGEKVRVGNDRRSIGIREKLSPAEKYVVREMKIYIARCN